MYNYVYVSRRERMPFKKDLINLINLVQDEVREYFTFDFRFIGSDKLNMVTCDFSQNIGFDFDVNLLVNDDDEKYDAKKIKSILMNAFDKILGKNDLFHYDYVEDNTRVFTIKIKDKENSRIIHSCDFGIINYYGDDKAQYIRHNKSKNTYSWEEQEDIDYRLPKMIAKLRANNLWNEVRKLYIQKKNKNSDTKKKSRSIRKETIKEIYNNYFEN